MPRVAPKYPEQGESSIADAIRQRRGERGLTVLDGTLLNAPEIAVGWNTLLGAIRTKNSLPGDIRELMILRVAARNSAAFEWLHHEHVGRDAGLSIDQLSVIRDTSRLGNGKTLSPVQSAALAFADAMTVNVTVSDLIYNNLKSEFAKNLPQGIPVEQQMTEAAATVGAYNLVSRFLVALDVGDYAKSTVAFPSSKTESHNIQVSGGSTIHAVVHTARDDAPWLVFVNSLLTNLSMWDGVVARLAPHFNIVTYDQRGHGKSSVPAEPCTIDVLADDINEILQTLGIRQPIRAIVGVSQGGATTLAAAIRHPNIAERFVICDTQAKSPATSQAAWDERIQHAKSDGMPSLAELTVGRWFPATSPFVQGNKSHLVRAMISSTPFEGFVAGARALQKYDYSENFEKTLAGKKILVLAGELDGALPAGLQKLSEQMQTAGIEAKYKTIPGAGHLPMLDNVSAYLDALEEFLP